MSNLNTKVLNATKWSAATEIVAKLILPITNMVLARLLTPAAFGLVATITMIISFAEIFTDAGFQKYLIQHEFKDAKDRDESTNVAFWSNFAMSLLLWLIIGLFCNPLARWVGNPDLGYVIVIACVSLPLAAFSSIQMALYKRDFDFKTLFKVRIIGICVPLVITIPLAFLLRNFWALILGTIAQNIVNAVIITLYSKWKPRWFYSFAKFKEMFSFTMWSMIEAVSIWMTSYIDIFIIGVYLNQYYLGIYKTSMTTVGQITSLITVATTPVLFASLSRLQNNENGFNDMFFKFQKLVGIFIIPLCVGIYCYRYLITQLLLGAQWAEAADFIGLWGIVSAISILLSHYCSELYRAKGRPKLSVLAQVLHIVVLCPVMLWAVHHSFTFLYSARSLVRLELVLVNIIITYSLIKISPWQMLKNIFPSVVAALIMGGISWGLHLLGNSVAWNIVSICICVVVFFLVVIMFKKERQILFSLVTNLLRKNKEP